MRCAVLRLCQLCVVAGYEVLLRGAEYRGMGGEMGVPLLMLALPLAFYATLTATGTSFEQVRYRHTM